MVIEATSKRRSLATHQSEVRISIPSRVLDAKAVGRIGLEVCPWCFLLSILFSVLEARTTTRQCLFRTRAGVSPSRPAGVDISKAQQGMAEHDEYREVRHEA